MKVFIMKKCMKSQRCKNLTISYFVGCLFAIICVICTSSNSNDPNGFSFGFNLFLFCQMLIWEPLSVLTILFIYKTGILPSIMDRLWQCVLYALLPSLLMLTDAYLNNVWFENLNIDSILLLVLVYLSYYIVTVLIAILHRFIISFNKDNGHGTSDQDTGGGRVSICNYKE